MRGGGSEAPGILKRALRPKHCSFLCQCLFQDVADAAVIAAATTRDSMGRLPATSIRIAGMSSCFARADSHATMTF